MEKTITFEMTESQAQKFEKLLDATLEILNRMKKESPERDARMDKMQAETRKNLAEAERNLKQASERLNQQRNFSEI